MKYPKIFLIGMPGSGKTTLASKLAEELNVPCIDLDQKIEKSSGIKISKIFENKGEEYFRKLERKLLLENLASSTFVMATGGGTPCFFDNMDRMKKAGLTIFLDVPIDDLALRLGKSHTRPLLKTNSSMVSELATIREKRINYYQKASIRVKEPFELKWFTGLIKKG